MDLGKITQATDLLEQAAAIHHAAGDRSGEAEDLRYAGAAYAQAGHAAEARERWERSYRLFRDLGYDAQATAVRSQLAEAGAEPGDD